MDERAEERRSAAIFRAAIAGSLFVHALAFFLYGLSSAEFPRLRIPIPLPTKQPDAIVTLSNAIKIEHRAHPRPQPAPHREAPPPQRPAVARPQRVAALPEAQPLPKLEVAAQPPVRTLHELAKTAPSAPPEPPKTVKTAEPKPVATTAPEGPPKQVAYAERATPSKPSRLSQAQLAQMNENFNKTLAELRRESDPLAVHGEPAAPKRYQMQMIGVDGDLRHGQGYYYQVKGWKDGGYDYYYVSYRFTWADGTVETGGVPWPIRFKPKEDPFANPGNEALAHVQLPPPLPGWKLPPGEKVGKALEMVFADELKAAESGQ